MPIRDKLNWNDLAPPAYKDRLKEEKQRLATQHLNTLETALATRDWDCIEDWCNRLPAVCNIRQNMTEAQAVRFVTLAIQAAGDGFLPPETAGELWHNTAHIMTRRPPLPIQLDWRPLLEYSHSVYHSSYHTVSDAAMVGFSLAHQAFIPKARKFFSPRALGEILDYCRPLLVPGHPDSALGAVLLAMFAPVKFTRTNLARYCKEQGLDKTVAQDVDRMTSRELHALVHPTLLPVYTEIVETLVALPYVRRLGLPAIRLIADIAANVPGMDWTDAVPKVMARFAPVVQDRGSDLKTPRAPAPFAVSRILCAVMGGYIHQLESLSRFIVYGVLDTPGGVDTVLRLLRGFAPVFFPRQRPDRGISNAATLLTGIARALCLRYCRASQRPKYRPAVAPMGPGVVGKVVAAMAPIVIRGAHFDDEDIAASCRLALRDLCQLRPLEVIPLALVTISDDLANQEDSAMCNAALVMLTDLIDVVVDLRRVPMLPALLPPVLDQLLLAIDPNDPEKTGTALNALREVLFTITIGHCTLPASPQTTWERAWTAGLTQDPEAVSMLCDYLTDWGRALFHTLLDKTESLTKEAGLVHFHRATLQALLHSCGPELQQEFISATIARFRTPDSRSFAGMLNSIVSCARVDPGTLWTRVWAICQPKLWKDDACTTPHKFNGKTTWYLGMLSAACVTVTEGGFADKLEAGLISLLAKWEEMPTKTLRSLAKTARAFMSGQCALVVTNWLSIDPAFAARPDHPLAWGVSCSKITPDAPPATKQVNIAWRCPTDSDFDSSSRVFVALAAIGTQFTAQTDVEGANKALYALRIMAKMARLVWPSPPGARHAGFPRPTIAHAPFCRTTVLCGRRGELKADDETKREREHADDEWDTDRLLDELIKANEHIRATRPDDTKQLKRSIKLLAATILAGRVDFDKVSGDVNTVKSRAMMKSDATRNEAVVSRYTACLRAAARHTVRGTHVALDLGDGSTTLRALEAIVQSQRSRYSDVHAVAATVFDNMTQADPHLSRFMRRRAVELLEEDAKPFLESGTVLDHNAEAGRTVGALYLLCGADTMRETIDHVGPLMMRYMKAKAVFEDNDKVQQCGNMADSVLQATTTTGQMLKLPDPSLKMRNSTVYQDGALIRGILAVPAADIEIAQAFITERNRARSQAVFDLLCQSIEKMGPDTSRQAVNLDGAFTYSLPGDGRPIPVGLAVAMIARMTDEDPLTEQVTFARLSVIAQALRPVYPRLGQDSSRRATGIHGFGLPLGVGGVWPESYGRRISADQWTVLIEQFKEDEETWRQTAFIDGVSAKGPSPWDAVHDYTRPAAPMPLGVTADCTDIHGPVMTADSFAEVITAVATKVLPVIVKRALDKDIAPDSTEGGPSAVRVKVLHMLTQVGGATAAMAFLEAAKPCLLSEKQHCQFVGMEVVMATLLGMKHSPDSFAVNAHVCSLIDSSLAACPSVADVWANHLWPYIGNSDPRRVKGVVDHFLDPAWLYPGNLREVDEAARHAVARSMLIALETRARPWIHHLLRPAADTVLCNTAGKSLRETRAAMLGTLLLQMGVEGEDGAIRRDVPLSGTAGEVMAEVIAAFQEWDQTRDDYAVTSPEGLALQGRIQSLLRVAMYAAGPAAAAHAVDLCAVAIVATTVDSIATIIVSKFITLSEDKPAVIRALAAIAQTARHWRSRVAVLTAIMNIKRASIKFELGDEIGRMLLDMTLSCLTDRQPEVSTHAAIVLEMLVFDMTAAEILAVRDTIAKIEEPTARVKGLDAIIRCCPYHAATWLPATVMLLCDAGRGSEEAGKLAENALSAYKRSHAEHWQEERQCFTRRELDAIETVFTAPSHYT
ncbi:Protein of unknown function DUF3437 [Carpediemonas membranifera]|uniref:Uncharacterized protein n=1 Tax=Carpediemonas membranifera TaxID=201153 RepID=A0A8J6BCX3_9EUKA|nr:Protein of unknown function DUF3437 [Carpediemonas membranifera]|eukprot:KAG9394842.1 Protein of unknown function DUF3437 [Carpediemonas membranifera]